MSKAHFQEDQPQQIDAGDNQTLGLDHRPTVAQVIAIAKRVVYEDRWYRRLGRWWHRARRYDVRAAWFRTRMRLARIRNAGPEEVRALILAEARRVERIVQAYNFDMPRDQHVRGKVYLPRGAFVSATLTDMPETVDLVWPRSRRA